MIDQGLVYLGQPSVTTNPLPAHTTHVVPPPVEGIHSIDFPELDDHINILSWDELELEPIASDEINEIGRVTLGHWMSTPFRLILEAASVQTTIVKPLTLPHYNAHAPFILIPDVEKVHTLYVDVSQTPYVDNVHTSDVQYVIRGGRVVRQHPPTAARPLEGISSHEEVRREDDKILRQLQSTQARISI